MAPTSTRGSISRFPSSQTFFSLSNVICYQISSRIIKLFYSESDLGDVERRFTKPEILTYFPFEIDKKCEISNLGGKNDQNTGNVDKVED